MKKRFLAIAIATGIATPFAASATPTVYGQLQAEIGSWGGDTADGMSVEDRARGRLGVKASEDLGNGLTGLAKAEFIVDTADGDLGKPACPSSNCGVLDDSGSVPVALSKREIWVGLKGGFGTVELGRLKSAYKYYGGVTYDPFVTSMMEARGNGGMSGRIGVENGYGHNSFISDSLGYSYKMGAISFRLTYDFDDGGGEGVTSAGGNNGMTLGLKYKTKMWEVIFSMMDDDNPDATEATDGMKVGGKFNMGGAGSIAVQYEDGEIGGVSGDIMYLDYQFPMGKNDIIDFAYGSEDNDAAADSLDFMRLAWKHKLSKQTSTWIGYRSTEGNTDGTARDETVIAVGMRKDF